MIEGRRKRKKKWAPFDPRWGPVPTEAPEDWGIDTRDPEADRKQSDKTENKGSESGGWVAIRSLLNAACALIR
jgi:hypothetical protein